MKSPRATTVKLALVGHPVAHSLSPPLYRAALAYCGLEGTYELIDVQADELNCCVQSLQKQGFSGFNVTVPHKLKACALCHELSDEGKATGAANAIRIDNGTFTGHNTDVGGFLKALSGALPGNHDLGHAVIVGSGGVARSVLWGLATAAWRKIIIVARNYQAASMMIETFKGQFLTLKPGQNPPELDLVNLNGRKLSCSPDLLVNCTPIGLVNQACPKWLTPLLQSINPDGLVFDTVYPTKGNTTALDRQAHRLKLKCLNGLDMLIWQAALAFEFFTGQTVPESVWRQGLACKQSKALNKAAKSCSGIA